MALLLDLGEDLLSVFNKIHFVDGEHDAPKSEGDEDVRVASRRVGHTNARIDHHDRGVRPYRLSGQTDRVSLGIGSIADRNKAIAFGRVCQSSNESCSAGRVIAAHKDTQSSNP